MPPIKHVLKKMKLLQLVMILLGVGVGQMAIMFLVVRPALDWEIIIFLWFSF